MTDPAVAVRRERPQVVGPVAAWLDRLTGLAVHADDTEDEVLQKRLQTGMAWISLPVILVAGSVVAGLHGEPAFLWLPAAYAVATAGVLAQMAWTRRYDPFRRAHPFIVLLAPIAYQWQLGGFVPSGGFGFWASLAVVASLMFMPRREAGWWFGAFVALLAASLARDAWFPGDVDPGRAVIAVQLVINMVGVTAYMAGSIWYFVRELEREKERSEALLRNVLPEAVARRLRRDPKLIADRFDDVTVLFTDLVGFTSLSGRLSPEDVVVVLNGVFTLLDGLAEEHGLEKIKTIGDAYLVVGGLPEPCPDHAERVARFALGVQPVVSAFARQQGIELALRVGVHCGPVVAGVIGRRKFAYDLWGDTVNTASRMESHGEPGRIHVSADVRDRLADRFTFEPRGVVDVKGKGPMATWWLTGERA